MSDPSLIFPIQLLVNEPSDMESSKLLLTADDLLSLTDKSDDLRLPILVLVLDGCSAQAMGIRLGCHEAINSAFEFSPFFPSIMVGFRPLASDDSPSSKFAACWPASFLVCKPLLEFKTQLEELGFSSFIIDGFPPSSFPARPSASSCISDANT